MKIHKLEGYYRHDVIKLLPSNQNRIGVELGVASGAFSMRMVESGVFEYFFGVDMYADHHNTEEYKTALKYIGLFTNYKLLRMAFNEALELFDDQSIDFVYIDGYAHSGEEGADTIYRWYDKVKIGGVLAGDDYHEKWPLVVKAVNTFAEEAELDLYRTVVTETQKFCNYPSWAVIKKAHQPLIAPIELVKKGKDINDKVRKKWIKNLFIQEYLKPIFPRWSASLLRFFISRKGKDDIKIS